MAYQSESSAHNSSATIDLSQLSDEERQALHYWCHFCGRPQAAVQKLIAGQGVYVCDICTQELPSQVPEKADGIVVELPLAQPVDRPQPFGGYNEPLSLPVAEPELYSDLVGRMSEKPSRVPRRCSFCGKSQVQVRVLFYAGFAFICDECVHLCEEIIAEERAAGASGVESLSRRAGS